MDELKTPAVRGEKAVPPAKGAEAKAILERAIDGDESTLPVLNAWFDDPERGPRLAALFGDLPGFTADVVIRGASGRSVLLREAIRRKMEGIRDELAGPTPTAIERLLAERAAYSWLIVWRYEHRLASDTGELTLKQAEFHHRRIDFAHRRYLSSLRSLAAVRKLGVPSVRVNVGPHHHHEVPAEPALPCSCHGHDGSELPAFADRFGRL